MTDFSIANRPLPYAAIAGKGYTLGWTLGTVDDAGVQSPQDVGGVTDVRITLQLVVDRGVTAPDPAVYTLLGGDIVLGTETIDEVDYPTVTLTDPTGQPEGLYDLIFSMTDNGLTDPVLTASVHFIAQP